MLSICLDNVTGVKLVLWLIVKSRPIYSLRCLNTVGRASVWSVNSLLYLTCSGACYALMSAQLRLHLKEYVPKCAHIWTQNRRSPTQNGETVQKTNCSTVIGKLDTSVYLWLWFEIKKKLLKGAFSRQVAEDNQPNNKPDVLLNTLFK